MKRFSGSLISILLIVLLIHVYRFTSAETPARDESKSLSNNLVSLIAIIANPERLHDRIVLVSGYYAASGGHQVLFVSSESAKANILKNGVWLDCDFLPETEQVKLPLPPMGAYVMLKARVNGHRMGPNDLYSATLLVEAVQAVKEVPSQ